MTSPRVAVIIPNYNGKPHLDECFEGLRGQDFAEPFEIILSDNASKDDSVAYVREKFPDVKIVETGANLGFAGACNRGVAATQAEYVIILNNDVRLPPDWLRELVRAADESPPDVFSIGSRIHLYRYPDRLNNRSSTVSPIGGGFDVGLGAPAPTGPEADLVPTGAGCGAAVLYRRRLYDELHGMDESYFMYFEDLELGLRSWCLGYRNLCAPKSKLFHKFGGTSGGLTSPIKLYWGHRNQVRMIAKYFGPWRLFVASILFPPSLAIKCALQLRAKNPKGVREILRGVRDGFRDLPVLRKERAEMRRARKRSDGELRRLGIYCTPGELYAEFLRLQGLRREGLNF